MATLAGLVEDVYGMLYGMAQVERPKEDTLASAVSSNSDVTWRFDTTTLWNRGDYAEYAGTGGEIVVFTEDHPPGADATVRRAQRGTTAASSYAQGDVFYRNPVFPRYMIERFIEETFDMDLWPLVWTTAETTLTFAPGSTTYEMPAECGDVVQVYQVDLNSDGKFYPIDQENWDYVPVVAAAESTNGNFLRLFAVHDAAETVYVTYKRQPTYSDIANVSANIAAMVPWNVVGKLLAGTRVSPHRIAPGRARPVVNASDSQLSRDFEAFNVMFRRMRQDENRRLRREVPIQRRFRRRRVRLG